MRPGSVLVIHTTGSPDFAREIGASAPPGVATLDAAFSGGPAAVLAGELTIMVGGDAEAIDRVRPLLASYARLIFHVGSLGSGQTIKLLNNLLFATNLMNAAELLNVAAARGLDTAEAAKVIQNCSGASFALRSFLSPAPVAEALARSRPYVEKDVATVAASAERNHIDISAFRPTIGYFAKD
jgi:3-hydroxyisobutyrate dehydrogenase-like beta-hydroxyacid dehydrogenase